MAGIKSYGNAIDELHGDFCAAAGDIDSGQSAFGDFYQNVLYGICWGRIDPVDGFTVIADAAGRVGRQALWSGRLATHEMFGETQRQAEAMADALIPDVG